MSYGDTPEQQAQQKADQIKHLVSAGDSDEILNFIARHTDSNDSLKRLLQHVKHSDRRKVYDRLKPKLSFKPKAYFLLMN